jgi:hypothetical protein
LPISSSERKKLEENYHNNIFVEFEDKEIDFKVQNLYFKALETYSKYIQDQETQQKANDTFGKYFKYINQRFSTITINTQTYKSLTELYDYMKTNLDYELLMYLRLIYFDYRTLDSDIKKNKVDYRKLVAQLNKDGFNLSYTKSSYRDLMSALKVKKDEIKQSKSKRA